MKYPVLFSPIKIGTMEVRNRYVVPPMATGLARADGSPTEGHVAYWAARAKGGYGLLIVEAAAIDPLGKGSPWDEPGIWDDKFIPAWKKVTEEVHKYGAKIAIQLHHAGRQTTHDKIGGQPVAPSPIPCPVEREMPRELTTEEVYDLIEKFGDAARRARDAGFDAVEVHGAHGYLIAQFMSPYSNKRVDEFGGDFMGRMKFPVEIVKNIRRKVGNGYPIIFRLSGDERVPGGRDINDSRLVARVMEEAGVDAIHVSAGVYASTQYIIAPAAVPPGFNVYASEEIKKVVNIPVIAVGRINDPLMAEDILEDGKADLVALGRESLADPELPNKVAAGLTEEISPCIGCMQACAGYLFDPTKSNISCLVNPFTGREGELKVEKAEKSKNVMVVGGGPGGLEAAWVAAKRGHKVTLYEKENVLGGQYRIGAIPPTKQDILKAIRYYITMGKKYEVEYKTGVEVTEDLIMKENPDVVILATGGVPLVPNIKGIDNPKFAKAVDILEGKKEAGMNVLIVGGGMVGVETADFLGEHYHNVTIVEMLPEIARDEQAAVKFFLMERLNKYGVKAITNATVKEFLDDGVVYEKGGKEEKLTGFDTIVLSMGAKAYNPLEEKIKGKVSEVYVIGDAVEPRKTLEAIEEAARVAVKI
ncbi:NADH:flavin oxidoreductase [Petrotoga sp. HWH.PT.55.6.1]|jgi:2,4-dienoyl-CoA reductase-like NADH-dependent reductase (Old Yellow Enzyme family)/thioredoxin reductase|uniref:oxidoreductase n=1 Tax=unclassified Petrotoga TaxID=2620614 RepID=UPI000CA01F64|nr:MULTISPECIES: FAD-dependent oxidoreductase [unclassified Petrotoga]PNR89698.1 NADH:flavin oxidoreductase [Petrotoga sp. 9T1HF07.CasAA.8.2]PNR92946.1 NADH:flavin oxidoreductase [Petrotoga sp. HWHPT.55.6.3]RPD36104.1 NADH:flavin oxidoreductase [Petrotoga sp. HWH.PT.55.6.1]